MEQQPANLSWTENLVGVIEAQHTAAASDSNNNQPNTGVPDGEPSRSSTPDAGNRQGPNGEPSRSSTLDAGNRSGPRGGHSGSPTPDEDPRAPTSPPPQPARAPAAAVQNPISPLDEDILSLLEPPRVYVADEWQDFSLHRYGVMDNSFFLCLIHMIVATSSTSRSTLQECPNGSIREICP